MSAWEKLWANKGQNNMILEMKDNPEAVLLELKRQNGFDVIDGLSFDSFYGQYTEIRDNLQKNGNIKSVFEIGCGSGANLYLFEREGFETGGLDYSQSLIEVAKKVLASKEIFHMEAIDIQIEKKYDAVFSNSVFSYFDNDAYAESVLTKMYTLSKKAIGLIDIHNLSKKDDFIAYRKSIIHDYENKYKYLPKHFYSKDFFENFANKYNLKIEFMDSTMKGYWNNDFVFSCYMYHTAQ